MSVNLNDIPRGMTCCLSKAGLTEAGSTAGAIKAAAPNGAGIDYCINGIAYHKADFDDTAITAAAVQAELTSCLYLVCLDSGGNVSTVKGTAVLTAAYNAGSAVLNWPEVPANKCPIGAIKVDTASGYTFTANTTDLGGTGITDTYYDFIGMPTAPLSV